MGWYTVSYLLLLKSILLKILNHSRIALSTEGSLLKHFRDNHGDCIVNSARCITVVLKVTPIEAQITSSMLEATRETSGYVDVVILLYFCLLIIVNTSSIYYPRE